MHKPLAAVVVLMGVVASDAALAQARPSIPSTAQAGRERQQLLDQQYPATPRIQLQDGRPAPVFTVEKKAPPKRKKRGGSKAR